MEKRSRQQHQQNKTTITRQKETNTNSPQTYGNVICSVPGNHSCPAALTTTRSHRYHPVPHGQTDKHNQKQWRWDADDKIRSSNNQRNKDTNRDSQKPLMVMYRAMSYTDRFFRALMTTRNHDAHPKSPRTDKQIRTIRNSGAVSSLGFKMLS